MPGRRPALPDRLPGAAFARVRPTASEVASDLPGDDVVPSADVVMDRAFDVAGTPADVWPWIVQLGKDRAGWYLPRSLERIVPRSRRATRTIDPRWQGLAVGDVIPDWGGPRDTFEVAAMEPPSALVHRSRRGTVQLSWAIVLREGSGPDPSTRIHLRLRLGPVRRVRLAENGGGLFDLLTIAGLAAGLAERLRDPVRDGV